MKILGFWHFFVSRNPRNLRPESSSLVSTSLTHSGDDEDSEDSGIISLFFLLESPESSRRIQLQNVCVLHCLGPIDNRGTSRSYIARSATMGFFLERFLLHLRRPRATQSDPNPTKSPKSHYSELADCNALVTRAH